MKFFIVTLLLLIVTAAAGGWYWHVSSKPVTEFKTAKVERGELLATISATGTIEPQNVVDVGAQVAGLIQAFGKDANGKDVDYDTKVKSGQLLAQIDPAVYQADFETATAGVAQAQAAELKGTADLALAQAKLDQAKSNWSRAEKVGPDSDALSKNDYDMYKADYGSALATVEVAKAEIATAKTGVQQAKATEAKAKRNLDFCTINSPVDGVIITRRVNIGQTVVSSLNAPSLFLIGQDLTKMQIWVAVNEADIGKIFPGQAVTFTCDSFPGEHFVGEVNKIRLNASMTQNVVTYTVEVNTDNKSGRLLPYLTANVQFVVKTDSNVLLVPNASLRWYPSSEAELTPAARAAWQAEEAKANAGPKQAPAPGAAPKAKTAKKDKKPVIRHGMIWIKEGQLVRPVDVTLGPTDDINTEVAADALQAGDEVVLGEVVQSADNAGMHNPFLPQMNRHKH